VLFVVMLLAGASYGFDSVRNVDNNYNVEGWSFSVMDQDVDVDWEMLTGIGSTYAQLAAAAKIEVLIGEGPGATRDVTIHGIDSNGEKQSELVRATTTTAIPSSLTYTYFDYAEVSPESSVAVTIRNADDTFITSIPVGLLESSNAQHFPGEKNSYITGWGISVPEDKAITPAVKAQLRYYPTAADCLDDADGYYVLDRMNVGIGSTVSISTDFRQFPQAMKCGKNGYIAVFASSDVANATVDVLIQGYDK